MMDITAAMAPKSDQLNADDLMAGPRTVTIARVDEGSDEQPVNVHLQELPGRPFRPSKSMLRVLSSAYGPESDAWIGKRATLYRDSTVRFGRDEVGGIRISHLSDLPDRKPLKVALTVTRGKRAPFTVQPLPDAPQPESPQVQALREEYRTADPERRKAILAEVEQATGGAA